MDRGARLLLHPRRRYRRRECLCGKVFRAAGRVSEQRVAAVDNDVSGFEVRQQRGDGFIDRRAGLHHQHDAARPLEQRRQLLDAVCSHDIGPLGLVGNEVIDFGDRPVEHGNLEPVVVHVEDEILSHDCKADEANVARCFWHAYSPNGLRLDVAISATIISRSSDSLINPSARVLPRSAAWLHGRGDTFFPFPPSGTAHNLHLEKQREVGICN